MNSKARDIINTFYGHSSPDYGDAFRCFLCKYSSKMRAYCRIKHGKDGHNHDLYLGSFHVKEALAEWGESPEVTVLDIFTEIQLITEWTND